MRHRHFPWGQITQTWSISRTFRRVLVIVLIYVLLRLAMNGFFLIDIILSGETEGYDLQIYLDAAGRIQLGQDLYPSGEILEIEFYQYAPTYALAFVLFRWMPFSLVVIIHTLLHIVAYILLYSRWDHIFRHLKLDRAREMLAWSLPVWLIFSAFWSDLGYLNIYIFMALLATLLIEFILKEQLGWSVLWLTLILQAKPQWAFAAAVPLLLGRYRFFVKLLVLTIVSYAAVAGITLLLVGPQYGWEQYSDYFQVLWGIQGGNYPWRGPGEPFLSYNHSITQIVVYLLGITPGTLLLAKIIKGIVLLPLGVTCIRYILRPSLLSKRDIGKAGLDFAMVLYLGAFIWLDVVWELTLSIAVFTYLLATLEQNKAKLLTWAVFMPYVLLDLWRVISFIAFGPDVVVPGPFVLTDPSIYIPMVMILTISFYALLVKRLWQKPIPVKGFKGG